MSLLYGCIIWMQKTRKECESIEERERGIHKGVNFWLGNHAIRYRKLLL